MWGAGGRCQALKPDRLVGITSGGKQPLRAMTSDNIHISQNLAAYVTPLLHDFMERTRRSEG